MTQEHNNITPSQASSTLAPVSSAVFPRELEYNIWEKVNRKFVISYLVVFATLGSMVFGLSFWQPELVLTKEDALKIKERYARLELTKPKTEEPKKPEKSEEKQNTEAAQKALKPKIDRSSETKAQMQVRKTQGAQARAEVRNELKQEIEQSGLFAELTALGDEGEGEVDDLLAEADGPDLGQIDLNGSNFTARPKQPSETRRERRGSRIESNGIGRQKIERASVKSINVTANVQLASPDKVEGAASGESSRSGSAISLVISKIQGSIKLQYEKYLREDPSLTGRVDVEFTIQADGSVAGLRIVRTTLNHSALESRITRMLGRLKFSPASSDVKITYPFVFAPTGT